MKNILTGNQGNGRIKVVIVPHPQNVFPPAVGSVAGVVWESARRLAASCEVTIFSRRQPDLEKLARVEGVGIRRVAVAFDEKIVLPVVRRLQHYLGLEKFALFRFYFYLGFIIKTAVLIRRLGCQIIHLHNYTQFAPIIRWFNPSSKIILHMHCHWLVEMDWRTINRRLRAVDLVISPSASITEQTCRRFPHAAAKCVTVPNGVDTQLFSKRSGEALQAIRRDYGLLGKDVILFVGRITPEKGVHVLIEAMARVQPAFPDAILVLAGASYLTPISAKAERDELYRQFERMKKNYPGYLNDLIAHHGLEVVFAGFKSRDELVNLYSVAAIVVIPSFEEAGPLPVLEAMSCQAPVVATAVDGIRDYVPSPAEILVPPNDPAALAEGMIACLSNRALREKMGRYGRQWVEAKFTWELMVNSLLSLYARLAPAPNLQEPMYEPEYAA